MLEIFTKNRRKNVRIGHYSPEVNCGFISLKERFLAMENSAMVPIRGIIAARINTGLYETWSTSSPVKRGKSNPLRPDATPLSPVARPTAFSGNRSMMAPYIFAERKLCAKITRLMVRKATDVLATNGTARLATHRVALLYIVIVRTL